MDTASSPYRVRQCSKCPGDKEYHCVSCPCDLCPQCKENHVTDLTTIDHDVLSYRDKNFIPTQEICVRHPSKFYTKYCKRCELPVCYNCRKHRTHTQLDIGTSYKKKQKQHRGTIHTIRSEALFYRHALLTGIKADVKTCHTEFSLYQLEVLTKAKTLKSFIDYVLCDLFNNVFCDFLKHEVEMSRHIVSLQGYEHMYVQPAFTFSALHFLSSIKTAFPQLHVTIHTSQLSMNESLNKEYVIELMSAIQITERENRRVGNQCLLKLMSGAEFHQSITVKKVNRCYHISCLTSDRIWVSDDKNNLILTDTTGVSLHRVDDSCSDLYVGLHTVNSESELIYINENYNINKLSKDMKTTTTFIERTDNTWVPRCVHMSPSTGDLLVGMRNDDKKTGKVTRYNQSGELTQTIQLDNTGQYEGPSIITENNNGDVVVSLYYPKSGAVVVTERGGRHRFSYKGPPSESKLQPLGICTDTLSHILVCDMTTKTVQMLNKDGQFLSHLLTHEMGRPWGLSYDINTHRLWIGSGDNNKVCVYRYITRQDALADEHRPRLDGDPMFSSTPVVE